MAQEFHLKMGRSEDWENELTRRLIEYNKTFAPLWALNHDGPPKPDILAVFALDADGDRIGGLIGRTHHIRMWFEVSILWVTESCRRQGIGATLLRRAEEEAIERGCRFARLATSQFQAPRFYEKQGYTLYGTLEDCPPGDTVYYYRKTLVPTEPIR